RRLLRRAESRCRPIICAVNKRIIHGGFEKQHRSDRLGKHNLPCVRGNPSAAQKNKIQAGIGRSAKNIEIKSGRRYENISNVSSRSAFENKMKSGIGNTV
ncbi:hypothetical protein AVEN_158687-1, partial [Araneus ventricosus]